MHLFKPSIFATLWLLWHLTVKTEALKAKFTNLECMSSDKTFATFKHCYLKAIARDKVALYVYLKLHQLPVQSITLNVALYQKGNGYRPFMYNNTIDFCAFRLRKSRLMFWKIIYESFEHSTNINHSCPYNHDIIVDGLILKEDMFTLIPFPPNVYQMRNKWLVSNSSNIEVRYSMEIYN